MITDEQKRLQELEYKIAIFTAQYNEDKRKLLEIETLKNDLFSLKEENQRLSTAISKNVSSIAVVSQDISKKDAEQQKEISLHSQTVTALESSIAEISNALSNQRTYVDATKKSLLEITTTLSKEAAENRVQWGDSVVTFRVDLAHMGQEIKALMAKIEALKSQIATRDIEIAEHDENLIISLGEKVRAIGITYDAKISKLEQTFTDRIKASRQEIPTFTDYGPQIAEIKKDLAVVLNIVHNTSIQSPDQDKTSAKIKTMERSIAQIYELLKKYEPGS